LLLNCELVSRVKLCLVSVFPDIVKDRPKMRNLPKIFLRSFEYVVPQSHTVSDLIIITLVIVILSLFLNFKVENLGCSFVARSFVV